MKVKSLLVTFLVAFIGASSVVVAQRTTIQLGMVLPANSVWISPGSRQIRAIPQWVTILSPELPISCRSESPY